MVLICISLKANDAEHLFMCFLPSVYTFVFNFCFLVNELKDTDFPLSIVSVLFDNIEMLCFHCYSLHDSL